MLDVASVCASHGDAGELPVQANHVLAPAPIFCIPDRSQSAPVLLQDVDGRQHVQVPWQVAAVLGRLLQHTPSGSKQAQHSWAGVAPAPVLQPVLCFMQVVERLLLYVHVQCAGSSGLGAAAGA